MSGASYQSGPEEYLYVGIMGLVLYLALGTVVTVSFMRGNKNEMTYYFFLCMTAMCALELPRFIAMMATREYSSKLAYISHLLASAAFFAGFSCVCYQWKGLLRLGTYSTLMYSARGIVISNAVFGCVEVVAMLFCALARSLNGYFNSYSFQIFTFVDAFKNVVFAGFLSYYGLRLISRFWRFRNADSNGSNVKSVFSVALHRLTVALSVSTACFAVRVTMLCLKMAVLHSSTHITSERFKFFGLFWFTLADFIPRVFPSLAFIALMMYSRRENNSDLNKGFLNISHEIGDPSSSVLDESMGGTPLGHFSFLNDGHSPRALGYDYYDELSYYEDEHEMELNDQQHMSALGYSAPKVRSPTRGRKVSYTDV